LSEPWISRLEKKITQISDQDYDPGFFSFKAMLVAVSRLYRMLAGLRLRLYRYGWLRSRRLPCFVISIGNITAGGVGKTPMAVYLAELLAGMGKRAVVISRGYKGSLKFGAGLVGDGDQVFMDAETAGDEPFMMALRKRFPVVVGKDRYQAGLLAMEQLNPDVVVLDDAFQHVQLERDLDILLLDHDRPLGNHRILPAGRLRETPATAKQRAHVLVFTRCPVPARAEPGKTQLIKDEPGKSRSGDARESTGQVIREFGKPLSFKTRHIPFLLYLGPGGKKSGQAHALSGRNFSPPPGLDTLQGQSGILFSGLANNKSFREAAEELGVNVMDHIEFKDHYRYKGADLMRVRQRAREIGADLILTTEKDWVKLDTNIEWHADLAVIGIRIVFEDPDGFETFIRSRMPDNRQPTTDNRQRTADN
jgi:tetraacyldisaccharide 4'-kinase